MATFKPGDKVRFVRPLRGGYRDIIGKEGVFLGPSPDPGWDCHVEFGPGAWFSDINCMTGELEPLVPPDESADRFLEKIRSWGPLPEPIRESIVVTEDATYSVKGESVKRISQ